MPPVSDLSPLGQSSLFSLLEQAAGGWKAGEWELAPGLLEREVRPSPHLSVSASLPFHLALPLMLPTSGFLSLESAAFCPLCPELHLARAQVSSPGIPLPPAVCLVGPHAVQPCLGPSPLTRSTAAHQPEPGQPLGQPFTQLWLLHTSAGATWEVWGDQDQREKRLIFWFILSMRHEAMGTAERSLR